MIPSSYLFRDIYRRRFAEPDRPVREAKVPIKDMRWSEPDAIERVFGRMWSFIIEVFGHTRSTASRRQ